MVSRDAAYAPLAREPKLADRATQQLQSLITRRTFQPGDRLPSERELGSRLGVSRTVIREALRTLSTKGLVEVRDGAGAYVRAPSTDLVSELLGICVSHMETGDVTSGHILEMRRILEIEMSGLAAERRGPDDLAELERFLAGVSPNLLHRQWRCNSSAAPCRTRRRARSRRPRHPSPSGSRTAICRTARRVPGAQRSPPRSVCAQPSRMPPVGRRGDKTRRSRGRGRTRWVPSVTAPRPRGRREGGCGGRARA